MCLVAILEPELHFFIDGRHQMSRRDRLYFVTFRGWLSKKFPNR